MTSGLPRVLLMTGEWPVPGRPKALSTARQHADALHAAGVTVEIFAFRARRNFVDYALAWSRLRPQLRSGSYDLVHAQSSPSALLALPKLLPFVVTLRESDFRAGAPFRRLASRIVALQADAVIIESAALRQRVRTAAPVHVIPLGIDEETLSARLLDVYSRVRSS